MIKRIQEAKSLSSSSAFIIIIVLVVVSVAAIVIGGGDGFSRKYAGIDLREFSGKMLLAQTGVVGKILKFQENADDTFTLDLLPIELDGSLLSGGEKYVASVVPPREGDTPFSYRPEEGLHVTQGYPILREYAEQHNLGSLSIAEGAEGVVAVVEENYELPDIPGMEVCSAASTDGHFDVFYEDIAYDTNVGFDDPLKGSARRTEVCRALKDFEDILLLDDLGLKPGIVIQASTEKTPEHSLSVVSPQYVGGSGFVSTLLADYLRSGLKRSDTSFSDNISVLGINSGFMRFNFEDDIDWSVDTGQTGDYDLATVTRQNMLRLLGFGSFLGHEQENILSSAWERWTEWDRLLFDAEQGSLIDPGTLTFSSVGYGTDFEPGDAEEYDNRISGPNAGALIAGYSIPDVFTIPSAQGNLYETFVSSQFQKGQSLSGLANEDAVSYPILSKGQVKTVTQQEKEILCMLGLGVEGVEGCDEGPRAVAQDIYIERQNNKTVCVNIGRGSHSSVADKFNLDGEIAEMTGGVDMGNSEQFRMYSVPCDQADFDSVEERDDFAQENQTQNPEDARSFSWTPSQSEALYRQYVQFAFSVTDNVTGRKTDQQTVSIHKCVVTATGNQLCNGDFQFSGATSSIDYKLSSLEGISVEGQTIIACQSSSMPGWCAQGVQDGFSSEFGYTWHPYLINNPEAFDSEIEDSPRRYAGGSSGAIVQRLRVPLRADTSYLVTGKVYVTQNGLQPTFWYGSQDTVLRQPDGTYHVDYPEALAGGGDRPVINEYVLPEPLTTGEWHSFSWTLNSGGDGVTHIAFGGSNNNGFILYDDLSLQTVGECGSCLSDIDGDCVTNTADLMTLLESYEGECPGQTVGCEGDLTFDGVVNTEDLLEFISQYGSECLVDDNPGDGDGDFTGDEEVCYDRIDNDGDGMIDRDDPSCALDQNCEMAGTCETGPLCTDRTDNDGDGLIDSDDPDCPQNPVEICDNGIDDDGDGKIDGGDADCAGSVEICDDGIDNDGDGKIDGGDADCFSTGWGEICNNGIDDDGDGKIDAADSECGRVTPEICNNGIDDDGDGKVDLADKECGPSGSGRVLGATDTTEEDSAGTHAIFLDEDGIVQDISLKALLLEGEEVVPNSNGFSANYVVKIQNQGRSLQELNIVGVIPSMLSYNGHVSTEENVAYDRNSNTIVIPSMGRGDVVEIYFNVDITSNVCAQIQRGVSATAYNLLVEIDLCDEYQEIQSKVYQTKLLEKDAAAGTGTSLLKSVRSAGGGFEIATSICTDRIDNDGDGQIDKNDSDCVDTAGTSEFGENDCSDGVDNDSDGYLDLKDPQCQYSQGTSESDSSVPECTDGTDNDSDGLVDYRDSDCRTTSGTSESSGGGGGGGRAVECADGIDNDGDGDKDMADSDCDSISDGSESPTITECSDGIDNDDDKFTDYPSDPDCTRPSDDDETN